MLDLEKYTVRNGLALTAPLLNDRFYAIVRRLHELETLKIDWETAVSTLQNLGLTKVNEYIQPLIDTANARIAAIDTEARQLVTVAEEWADTAEEWADTAEEWAGQAQSNAETAIEPHNADETAHPAIRAAVEQVESQFLTEHNGDGTHKESFDLSESDIFLVSHNPEGGLRLPGFMQGLTAFINAADEIVIDAGCMDLSGAVYSNTAQTVVTLSNLSPSSTYHIYATRPTSGFAFSVTNFSVSTATPTYAPDKGAGYSGNSRWLGWLETDASGDIVAVESVHQFNAIAVGGLETYLVRETAPFGRIECDGSAISRTTYAALFSGHPGSIGTSFGAGNGSTTFNVADLRGRFLRVWAHGSSNDPDRYSRTNRGDGTTGDHPGTYQTDQNKSHFHHVGIQMGGLAGSNTNLIAGHFTTTTATGYSGGNQANPRNINIAVFCKYVGRL